MSFCGIKREKLQDNSEILHDKNRLENQVYNLFYKINVWMVLSMNNNFLYFNYMRLDSKYYERIATPNDGELYYVSIESNCEYSVVDGEMWKYYFFPKKDIQEQGWKIHIGATMSNAQQILTAVSAILFEKRIAFKHVSSESMWHLLNSKNGNRVSSGKFITIYPDDDEFVQLLDIIYDAIKDYEKGPYILSDRSWKDSNVYYRYGGFKKILNSEGQLCIKDKEGNLIPDIRTPYYVVPDFVEEHEELRNTYGTPIGKTKESELSRYDIKQSLRFSNSGGIYLAFDKKTNKNVIIKEARNKAGLDGNGIDAVQRLNNEYKMLERLSDVPGIVRVENYFKTWENLFLVEEYVEGIDLTHWIAQNYPYHPNQDIRAYSEKIQKIIESIKQSIIGMHNKNVGMGDMQPSNIMLSDALETTLIDFESADEMNNQGKPAMLTVGFADPRNTTNKERDWYGLKKIMKYCILPIGSIEHLNENIKADHDAWILKEYGSDFYQYYKDIEMECDSHLRTTKENCKEKPIGIRYGVDLMKLIGGLRDGLLSNCADRDSLIQGDIRQFETPNGKYNVQTGGFGAILALLRTGGLQKKHKEWISRYIQTEKSNVENDIGLLAGQSGIASVLYEAGYKMEAKGIFDKLICDYKKNDITLRSGLAGFGMALLYLYLDTQEEKYLKEIYTITDCIKKYEAEGGDIVPKDWAGVPIGLIDGWSGVSLFYSTMYMVTNDEKMIKEAVAMITKDLSNTVIQENLKVLQTLDDKSRFLPYLSGGSIGIAVAIWYLNTVSKQKLFEKELNLIINVSRLRCTFSAGLFEGMGSFLLIPAIIEKQHRKQTDIISKLLDNFKLFLRDSEEGIICPGNFSYRYSLDLYSGNAGIMLALAGINSGNPLLWMPLIKGSEVTKKIVKIQTI